MQYEISQPETHPGARGRVVDGLEAVDAAIRPHLVGAEDLADLDDLLAHLRAHPGAFGCAGEYLVLPADRPIVRIPNAGPACEGSKE